MNAVITANYNFDNEEVAANYIAFLKSIAIRLDDKTISLFYNPVFFLNKTLKRD